MSARFTARLCVPAVDNRVLAEHPTSINHPRSNHDQPQNVPVSRRGQRRRAPGPAAIEQLRAAVELDPTFARAHQELGRAYRQHGLADLAIAELTRAVALSDRASAPLAELASARAAVGDVRGARAIDDELERRARAGTYVSRYHFAVIAAALGDTERAVAELRAAYEDRFNWIVFVGVEPQFDGLRSVPGFQEIVARLRTGGSLRAPS